MDSHVGSLSSRAPINPGLLRTIDTAVAEFRPDVLHSHLWVTAAYGSVVGWRRGVPHVTTMHGDGEQTKYLRRRVALRFAFKHARGVVAVSDAMRNDLARSLGIAPSTMSVVANGSPFEPGDRVATRRELRIDDDETVILAVGSQIARKNHIVVLRAMRRLLAARRYRFVLAGPHGDNTELLASFAAEHGLANRFLNLGPRHDIEALLAATDIFVMPSLWEGMPVALVEAMGAGAAVVASAVGGIPQMEGHLLGDPTDDGALSTMLDALAADRVSRERYGKAAARRARREYGVATMADAYLQLYRSR
jgi:glycosyltransferase involved in cell wall biosynthesis